MKVRTGFVSNSSSSSFVAIIEEDTFAKALEQVDNKFYKKILKKVAKKKECLGVRVREIAEASDSGGFSSLFGEGGWDDVEEYADVDFTDQEREEIEEMEENGEEMYPADSIYEFSEILEEMAKKDEYKDKIYFVDDMGNG